MNKKQFLSAFKEMLQTDLGLTDDTKLKVIPEWDSLANLTTIAFFDKNFHIILSVDDLNQCITIGDLMEKSGGNITGD